MIDPKKKAKDYSMEEWLALSSSERSDITSLNWSSVDREASKVKTSDPSEHDLNSLVRRFGGLAGVPLSQGQVPMFGDFSSFRTLGDVMKVALEGKRIFEKYPSFVRDDFDNDADRFFAFIQDPKNLDSAIERKLLVPPKGYVSVKEREAQADAARRKTIADAAAAAARDFAAAQSSQGGSAPSSGK